jgi:hypothetical protein
MKQGCVQVTATALTVALGTGAAGTELAAVVHPKGLEATVRLHP